MGFFECSRPSKALTLIVSLTTLAACSGAGNSFDSAQSAQPQSVSMLPQSGAAPAIQTVGTQALHVAPAPPQVYLPDVRSVNGPLLSKPIIDDVGSLSGGPIIEAENIAGSGIGMEGIVTTGGEGVLGLAETSGDAVYGNGTGAHANGVYGYSSKFYGVIGNSTGDVGVLGETAAAAGYGGWFTNSNSSSTASAVKATSSGNTIVASSTNGYGIYATSVNGNGIYGQSGNGFYLNGVVGDTQSNYEQGGSAGVAGFDDTQKSCASACLNYGVGGYSNNNGFGVYGSSTGGGGAGIYGQGNGTAYGLYGNSSTGEGLYVNSAGGSTVMEVDAGGTPVLSVDSGGNLIVSGSLTVDGTINDNGAGYGNCAPSCPTPLISGRNLHAQIENVGDAQLEAGHAFVQMDSAFAARLDPTQRYHVFVTPEGDSNGLYVSAMTPSGFTVRENRGGRSSVAFEYRVVGTPRVQRLQRPHGSGPMRRLPPHSEVIMRPVSPGTH